MLATVENTQLTKYMYRWCDDIGGGLVFAASVEEAHRKLAKKYDADARGKLKIWPWEDDDYYDEKNIDVLDIYG